MARKKRSRRQRRQDAQKQGSDLAEGQTPLDVADEESRDRRSVQEALFAQHFSGPLPPPEILERYDFIVPGMAEQLLEAFIRQGEHRRSLEERAVDAQIRRADRGQWMAFLLALLTLGLGGAAIILGREIGGLVSVVGALVALVTVFLKGREQQSQDLRDKRE